MSMETTSWWNPGPLRHHWPRHRVAPRLLMERADDGELCGGSRCDEGDELISALRMEKHQRTEVDEHGQQQRVEVNEHG
jgi:hypothetical protein